nr:hypothetical protein [Tanacetum cinerariifolium]
MENSIIMENSSIMKNSIIMENSIIMKNNIITNLNLIEPRAFTRRYTESHYPKTYWESLPEDILGVITQRRTGSYYPKMYWESLPEDVLGVITRRRTGSYYPKMYWESLPEDVLGVITRRRTGSHYPKTYWESLPKDVMDDKEGLGEVAKNGGNGVSIGRRPDRTETELVQNSRQGPDRNGTVRSSNDGGNTVDGVKIVGGVIGSGGGIEGKAYSSLTSDGNHEPLPEDIPGVTTLRHTGSHNLKTYWESLPEDVLGVITRRRTRSHYLKTCCESLPEDVLEMRSYGSTMLSTRQESSVYQMEVTASSRNLTFRMKSMKLQFSLGSTKALGFESMFSIPSSTINLLKVSSSRGLCKTGLFEIAIALVLSQNIVATYSASADDIATDCCFLALQHTSLPPSN